MQIVGSRVYRCGPVLTAAKGRRTSLGMAKAKAVATRGGFRNGAGRPPRPEGASTERLSVKLTPERKARLDRAAQAANATVADLVNSWIDGL